MPKGEEDVASSATGGLVRGLTGRGRLGLPSGAGAFTDAFCRAFPASPDGGLKGVREETLEETGEETGEETEGEAGAGPFAGSSEETREGSLPHLVQTLKPSDILAQQFLQNMRGPSKEPGGHKALCRHFGTPLRAASISARPAPNLKATSDGRCARGASFKKVLEKVRAERDGVGGQGFLRILTAPRIRFATTETKYISSSLNSLIEVVCAFRTPTGSEEAESAPAKMG